MAIGGAAVALAVLLWPAAAGATWSIVAVDDETLEVGVAIASCVPADILGSPGEPLAPVVLMPGEGAAVTQGQLNLAAPARIRELVAAGAAPADIIDDLTGPEFDEVADLRQHALVTLTGEGAAYTGDGTSPEALDQQRPDVSVQGNLLADRAVVGDAADRFEAEREAGADLATALARALAAGSEAGGDRRCPDTTALFAQVAVAGPDDDPLAPSRLVTVTIAEGDADNPVILLAEAVDGGRNGWIDAAGEPSGTGGLVRLVVLVAAAVALVGGGWVFLRGLGSVRARR